MGFKFNRAQLTVRKSLQWFFSRRVIRSMEFHPVHKIYFMVQFYASRTSQTYCWITHEELFLIVNTTFEYITKGGWKIYVDVQYFSYKLEVTARKTWLSMWQYHFFCIHWVTRKIMVPWVLLEMKNIRSIQTKVQNPQGLPIEKRRRYNSSPFDRSKSELLEQMPDQLS